ncbi:MAG: hypothetical protein HYT71_03985 [Candidatus Aenigmarchaeota archaeon]|nr:hypothetical protein [Candidatus Aenigmarchaeota archaeon]
MEKRIKNASGYLNSGSLDGPDIESAAVEYGKARSELTLAGSYAKTPEQRQRYDKAAESLHGMAKAIINKGLETVREDMGASELYMQLAGDKGDIYHAKLVKAPSTFPFTPTFDRDPLMGNANTVYDGVNATITRAEKRLDYTRQIAEAENNPAASTDIESLGKSVAGLRQKLEARARGN